jgi:prepilin-type N-terminal cleavage/methylation domain-containing protein
MMRRGFSLFEVIVAIGVLSVGAGAMLMLYNNTLKAARQTKEELAASMIRQEIQARTQLAALQAVNADGSSAFAGSSWLMHDPDVVDDPGAPAPLDAPAVTPAMADAEALNKQSWEVIRQRFDDLDPSAAWDANSLHAGFQFRLRTVLPPEVENNQFTDWDGYDVWDSATRTSAANIYQDETLDGENAHPLHAPVHPPASARSVLPPNAQNEGHFGPPRPSHGVVYDPRGMKNYIKRIKCVIGWDLARKADIYSGQHIEFYFTVYNPDARKQP